MASEDKRASEEELREQLTAMEAEKASLRQQLTTLGKEMQLKVSEQTLTHGQQTTNNTRGPQEYLCLAKQA